MHFWCVRNLLGNHLFFQNSLVANFQKQLFAWTIFFVLIVFYADEARSLTNDLIQLNSTELFETDAPQDRKLTEVTQEHWQEMLSLAKKRLDKKEKDWRSLYSLENAMFPALAALVVAGWYFGDQIPVLEWLSPQYRAYLLVTAATNTAIIYPWVFRNARRWLYEGERSGWLLVYVVLWGGLVGVSMALPDEYGHSLLWTQRVGYYFLDLLQQSGDIVEDASSPFLMSLVSVVVADLFYLLFFP